jgi:SAM-dependent methyltransferase
MTKSTDNEEITNESYNSTAESWASSHWTLKFWGDNFDRFYELLPQGRLLEIGCGAGRDAKDLIAHGYDYLGTDISANLLIQARKNNPGAVFETASVYDLDFKNSFDGFWCAATLVHIPRDRIDEALKSIKKNIKAGGIGFISVKEGRGELLEQRGELNSAKFYFVFWKNDEFKEVLGKNGLEVLHEGYMPMSERTKWLTYIVKSN